MRSTTQLLKHQDQTPSRCVREPNGVVQIDQRTGRRLKGRRGKLLGIYKALLHNSKLAETWFAHLNAVR